MVKPRVRVFIHNFADFVYVLARGVPDDAMPGDLIVGNRGAAARVVADKRLRVLYLDYVGNYYQDGIKPFEGCKMHDRR